MILRKRNRCSLCGVILFLGIIFLYSVLLSLPSSLYANRSNASKKTLLIAAASNLRFAMDEIIAAFERESGSEVKISYGASGSLYAQIKTGAPYDLFFSADEAIPRQLIQEGFAERGSFFRYGVGQIVLWVPNDSEIDLEKEGMKALLHPAIHKIAIANPGYAPYGAAAISALKKSGLFQNIEKKLILGENISHAAQFVQSGGSEIGILSYSLAIAFPLKNAGRYWKIPHENYPEIAQAAVILFRSRNPAFSRVFMDFIRSGPGKNILARYGLLNTGDFQ